MSPPTFIIGLPIADRRRAMAFYQDAVGLTPVGPPAADGVPEPLQFQLGNHCTLMLIPSDGFGWVVADRTVAGPGVSECFRTMTVATDGAVEELVERVRRAGGEVVGEPEHRPWGYSSTWADLDGHLWQVSLGPGAQS